jgi:RNA polymerase sigma-70 factor (ECF subfamily)
MMGNLADAEDVVQDAYVKAYRSLVEGRFDSRSKVDTWLYRIVTNTAIDAMRSKSRRREDDVAVEGATAGDAESRLALAELDDWLKDLPPDQRVALTLTAIEGMSAPEAAEVLGVSEGAVEQRVVRARATLREKRKS